MQNFTVKNKNCTLSVDSFGAQLSSFTCNGTEYIWQRDPSIWSDSALILFPLIGVLKNETTLIDGKPYHIALHGFAKDTDFKLDSITDDTVTLSMESSDETLKVYPYNFKFSVEFKLEENSFIQTFIIENKNDIDMPYFVGGHPGFNVPMFEGEFSDHKLVFEKDETILSYRTDSLSLIDDTKGDEVFTNGNEIALDHSLFQKGALLFERLNSKWIKLIDKQGRGIKMDFADFDYFGIWHGAKNPNYICLEPWTGINDCICEDGVYKNKRGIRFVSPGETARLQFKVTAI